MAVRTGLQYLVDKIDSYIPTEAASFITDDEKQEILERNKVRVLKHLLRKEATFAENDYIYLYYYSDFSNLEKSSSGSAYFRLYDIGGTAVGTANYTADFANGQFTFATDQNEANYYIDCYSYDIYGAMAEIWEVIKGNTSGMYDVQIEGRRFNRSQWFAHCDSMIQMYKSKSPRLGSYTIPIFRGDF